MDFIGLQVVCDQEKRELIIAELSLLSFDAFEENELGVFASCDQDKWSEEEVKEIAEKYEVEYTFEAIARVNWNEEWEKNYDPVIVNDQCVVRATFHEARPDIPYEIIITPKMSFGTGHHATTHQVLEYQLALDHIGKKVLDVGCGTGALAIMAHKRGATSIAAVDIDAVISNRVLQHSGSTSSGRRNPQPAIEQVEVDVLRPAPVALLACRAAPKLRPPPR